jgi:transposase-like protein
MANKKYKDASNPFKWKHAVGEVILWLVTWYSRYALSYQDLKEIAAERGFKLDRSTIYRWVQEYAPEIKKRIKPHLKNTCDSWKIDETYVKIKGKWHYLYRAIDKEGNTLDWMLSVHRNKQSAKRFFKKLFTNQYATSPRVINVDKSPTFPPALSELQVENEAPETIKLRAVKYLNNRMENDHKFTKSKSRYRQWYQSFSTAKNTLDGIETLRMIQKGQVRYIGKDVVKQNQFVRNLFGIAA